jgi:hypothetical protein
VNEQLVYTSSDDGLLLEGVAVQPAAPREQAVSFVWIHGNAARFYDYPYVAICRALAGAGFPSLSGNTRGHDIGAIVWRGDGGLPRAWQGPQDFPIGGGAGWERLEDCPRDVAAWVDVAADLARGGVILVGHSSGAQRVVAYQAERQDARVRGLALASPDLRGFFMPGEVDTAQRMVDEGRGLEVLPAQPFAPHYRQSAASVVSRAAFVARMPDRLASLRCPVLAFVGDREPGGVTVPGAETHVIPGADHVYSSVTSEVAALLARWAASL